MLLLTSSQVSVLISSGIVVLCTAALFLSGYAIQQRTLNDLRRAINHNREPRPSPKIYLPDRFKTPTTELDDGTVVTLDDPRLGARRRIDLSGEDDVIVVRPTFPDEKSELQRQAILEKAAAAAAAAAAEAESREQAEKKARKQKKQKNGDGDESTQKPISRAERRRQIKEEIRRLSEGEERVYYQRRLW
ncbi:hypothetical protein GGR53DRAFT_322927 [Hypoxylon sp. FL1150]|nr:hypothetical protein GGR53DRAFT_322927 [Hypoxylon sp. FL1150]